MAAGLKTLELISRPGFHRSLGDKTRALVSGILEQADDAGIAMCSNSVGGMFGLFFSGEQRISNFSQVMQCDQELFRRFFHGMLEEGVYLAPSAFEAGFVSAAHDEQDIAATINAAGRVLRRL